MTCHHSCLVYLKKIKSLFLCNRIAYYSINYTKTITKTRNADGDRGSYSF